MCFKMYNFLFQSHNQQEDEGDGGFGTELCKFQSSTAQRTTRRTQRIRRSLSEQKWVSSV